LSGVPLFVTAPLIRRWHTRWEASKVEVAGPMSGDEIVPKASFNATRAITIALHPRGYGRDRTDGLPPRRLLHVRVIDPAGGER
jgi:hypothetical protein